MLQKLKKFHPVILYFSSALLTVIARELKVYGDVYFYILIFFALLLFILAIVKLLR